MCFIPWWIWLPRFSILTFPHLRRSLDQWLQLATIYGGCSWWEAVTSGWRHYHWAAASYLKVEGTVCALRCGFLISSHFTNGRLWSSDILARGVDSTWFFTMHHLTTNNFELGGINPKYVELESSLDRSKSLLYLVAQEYHSQAGSTRAAIEETILGGTHQNRALPC